MSSNSVSITESDSLYSSVNQQYEISNSQSSNSSQSIENLSVLNKTPIIEHVVETCNSDYLVNVDETTRLKRKIEILEEKCFALTCNQLDLKIKESGEIQNLLGKNDRLVKENYQLKQQYRALT